MNEIIPRHEIASLVEIHTQALKDIDSGMSLLYKAMADMRNAFGQYNQYTDFSPIDPNGRFYMQGTPQKDFMDEVRLRYLKGCWKVIVGRLELWKMASQNRIQQIDKNIDEGKLPPFTVEEVFTLLTDMSNSLPEIVNEVYKSVWNLLRPPGHWREGELKTNHKSAQAGIGKKVILSNAVRTKISKNYKEFEVEGWGYTDRIAELDKCFYLLDGKLTAETNTYRSPLVEAIYKSEDGTGETEYFKFKCYHNGRLHLEFKRMDLVQKLNVIMHKAILKEGKK